MAYITYYTANFNDPLWGRFSEMIIICLEKQAG